MFYAHITSNNGSLTSITLLSAFLLLCSMLANNLSANELEASSLTKVYKVVGDDGSVSFSDQPNSKSETILVPPVATVPAIDPKTATSAPSIKSTNTQLGSYTSLSILAPANDSAFYSAAGDVDVIVDVQPALLREDKLAFYLNNKLIQTDRQLQMRLPAVERGTHELKVQLLSPEGSVLKENRSIFTVHKPSIRN